MKERKKRKKSIQQEERVAETLGGTPVMASGSIWFAKGDVITPTFLVECKITKQPYYPFKQTEWDKIRKEAIGESRDPLFVVDLEDGETSLAILPKFTLEKGYRPDNWITTKEIKEVSTKQFRIRESDIIKDVPDNLEEGEVYYPSISIRGVDEEFVMLYLDDLARMVEEVIE